MRQVHIVLLSILLALTSTGAAGATDLTLDSSGKLHQLVYKEDQLKLISGVDTEEEEEIGVPGTTGALIERPIVHYNDSTATWVLVWQNNIDITWSQIMLATYRDGVWIGPIPVAGMGGMSASNPDAMVHEVSLEEKNGITTYSVPYIYLAWWADEFSEEGGYAVSATIPLENGKPLLGSMQSFEHREFRPFGIACFLTGTEGSLKEPRLIPDPTEGQPLVVSVELKDCLFSIIQIEVMLDPNPMVKRRRQITVWNRKQSYTVHPSLSFSNAKFDIGYDLSIVMYWDKDNAVDYALLNKQSVYDVMSLPLSEKLDRERAVELIRKQAHR
jgi:hypothetical protein